MERFYYGKSIAEFLGDASDAIFGALSRAESFDTARDQKNAWNEEIGLLKSILQGYEGHVFFWTSRTFMSQAVICTSRRYWWRRMRLTSLSS